MNHCVQEAMPDEISDNAISGLATPTLATYLMEDRY